MFDAISDGRCLIAPNFRSECKPIHVLLIHVNIFKASEALTYLGALLKLRENVQ